MEGSSEEAIVARYKRLHASVTGIWTLAVAAGAEAFTKQLPAVTQIRQRLFMMAAMRQVFAKFIAKWFWVNVSKHRKD